MPPFRLRTDLERAVVNGYALPLGLTPEHFAPPQVGYTVDYIAGEDDEPDTYAFYIVVSHEALVPLVHRLFELLPSQVFPILEIGSRDAYRSVDVFVGEDAMPRDEFLKVWEVYQPFLLEEGSIAAGANAEEPVVEIFVDQWKSVSVHIPLSMRDDVDRVLADFDLQEVSVTWPDLPDAEVFASVSSRPILDLADDFAPDVDDLLLDLRDYWGLRLNDDPTQNLDEAGRKLGFTLWLATVILEATDQPEVGSYASIWATASSRIEMEQLIDGVLASQKQYALVDTYSMDRIAYDERPDELADLPPRRDSAEVHLVSTEPWRSRDRPADRGESGGAR